MNKALLTVSTGLKLAFYGLMTMIVAAVIMFFGVCILAAALAGAAGGPQGGGGMQGGALAGLPVAMLLFIVVVGLVYLVGWITGLVGRFFCLAVPSQVGAAKAMITISLMLE